MRCRYLTAVVFIVWSRRCLSSPLYVALLSLSTHRHRHRLAPYLPVVVFVLRHVVGVYLPSSSSSGAVVSHCRRRVTVASVLCTLCRRIVWRRRCPLSPSCSRLVVAVYLPSSSSSGAFVACCLRGLAPRCRCLLAVVAIAWHRSGPFFCRLAPICRGLLAFALIVWCCRFPLSTSCSHLYFSAYSPALPSSGVVVDHCIRRVSCESVLSTWRHRHCLALSFSIVPVVSFSCLRLVVAVYSPSSASSGTVFDCCTLRVPAACRCLLTAVTTSCAVFAVVAIFCVVYCGERCTPGAAP